MCRADLLWALYGALAGYAGYSGERTLCLSDVIGRQLSRKIRARPSNDFRPDHPRTLWRIEFGGRWIAPHFTPLVFWIRGHKTAFPRKRSVDDRHAPTLALHHRGQLRSGCLRLIPGLIILWRRFLSRPNQN